MTATYSHDSIGRPATETIERRPNYTGGVPSRTRTVYTYESEKRALTIDTFESDGTLELRETKLYDVSGNLTEEASYKSGKTLRSKELYTYDKAGHLTSRSFSYNWDSFKSVGKNVIQRADGSNTMLTYDEAGALQSRVVETVDRNGNIAKTVYYKADGTIEKTGQSEYDSRGNWIKTVYYEADGTIEKTEQSEYDSRGNWIKRTTSSETNYREISYYD
jgi:hypothetical protein